MIEESLNRWRPNVAAVIMDREGNILLASPTDPAKNWHFPQGGVSKKETLKDALRREVQEEVGLYPDQYRIICSIGGYRYQYKEDNEKSTRWKGQEQTYFLLLCHEEKPVIDLSQSPEFHHAQWLPWRDVLPEMFVRFKRETIRQVLETFFPSTMGDSGLSSYLEHTLSPRRYLLQAGEVCSLAELPSDDRALFAGGKAEARAQLSHLYKDILRLHQAVVSKRMGRLLVLFHGVERCGCEGVVQRLAHHMEPFGLRVESLSLYEDEERTNYDFIYPLHKRVPTRGEAVLMDRSVYNSLRVDYLEGKITDEVLLRRLTRLNEFEEMLAEEGTTVIKIYLHISRDEQQRRFNKQHFYVQPHRLAEEQIGSDPETWQREMQLSESILTCVNSSSCPWYIIPADKKWYRDLCVTHIVIDTLQQQLHT